ncbi:hypothetical protein BN381_720002 [Candidatus Microthrix parvicella RN1]|uniref:Uncharacterized protein n=1 Tax=Candidatus Neomicrothrix parvicella RN1 TaxID=1229780 RepID=R4Z3Z6_9ACTN|nr:hypothetical protein BN381_720002 [Candidatus Microthrix parvicella RN1]
MVAALLNRDDDHVAIRDEPILEPYRMNSVVIGTNPNTAALRRDPNQAAPRPRGSCDGTGT